MNMVFYSSHYDMFTIQFFGYTSHIIIKFITESNITQKRTTLFC